MRTNFKYDYKLCLIITQCSLGKECKVEMIVVNQYGQINGKQCCLIKIDDNNTIVSLNDFKKDLQHGLKKHQKFKSTNQLEFE